MKRMMPVLVGVLLFCTGQTAFADGKAVYDANCGGCHNNIAPKLGDKAAWAPRIAKGVDALTASATKGKKRMPPRGGNASLSDDDLRAAVEYIIEQGK